MASSMLTQAVELMLYGMGIVFVFLVLLIVAINFMSTLMARFAPEIVEPAPAKPAPAKVVDEGTIAAITMAIHQYRQRHKRG